MSFATHIGLSPTCRRARGGSARTSHSTTLGRQRPAPLLQISVPGNRGWWLDPNESTGGRLRKTAARAKAMGVNLRAVLAKGPGGDAARCRILPVFGCQRVRVTDGGSACYRRALTVMVNRPLPLFPLLSMAEQFTRVRPILNKLPDLGRQVAGRPPSTSSWALT